MITIIFLTVVILLLGILLISRGKPKTLYKLPPGPSGLPLLGNALQLAKNPHLKFSEWAIKFGKLYTINLAGTRALLINDVKTMREIFSTFASTGKYRFELWEILHGPSNYGIINNEGNLWMEQQRFCLKTLKELGVSGGPLLEPLMLTESEGLCNWINAQLGNNQEANLDLGQSIMKASSNTIWHVVTGKSHKSSESELVHQLEAWMEAFTKATGMGLVFLPWLKYIIPNWSGYNDYVKATQTIQQVITKSIEKHQKERKEAGDATVVNDLMDAYLQEVENCKEMESIFYGENGIKHIFWTANSLLFAGSESAGSTISWLLSYLVAYPEVQEKLRQEIDSVLGKEGNPSLSSKESLPYLDAVVYETLRKSSFVAYGVPHQLIEDLEHQGFKLPKGLILIPNIYHANHDPCVWVDPENFRPERFLEVDGDEKRKLKECVAAFQEGKRKCPGEQMAKDLIFVITAKLVQGFSFEAVEGRNSKDYQAADVGFALVAPKYGFKVRRRAN